MFVSPNQSRIQQFEQQVRIMRLERELERAKKELNPLHKTESNSDK